MNLAQNILFDLTAITMVAIIWVLCQSKWPRAIHTHHTKNASSTKKPVSTILRIHHCAKLWLMIWYFIVLSLHPKLFVLSYYYMFLIFTFDGIGLGSYTITRIHYYTMYGLSFLATLAVIVDSTMKDYFDMNMYVKEMHPIAWIIGIVMFLFMFVFTMRRKMKTEKERLHQMLYSR